MSILKTASLAVLLSFGASTVAMSQDVTLSVGSELEDKRGDYGARDIDRLSASAIEAVSEALEDVGADDSYEVVVTLENAWPNRPTRRQLSANPGLSFESVSLGGASLTAIIYDGRGNAAGEVSYSWRTPTIAQSRGRGTWHDANRAFDRFADRVAQAFPAGATGSSR